VQFNIEFGQRREESQRLSQHAGSVTETDAPRKLLEPRFGAEGIEARSQEDARIESFLIAFFEPNHRLILIAESCVDHGNLRGMRIIGVRTLFRFPSSLSASLRLPDAA
jgi:hypothetical protein